MPTGYDRIKGVVVECLGVEESKVVPGASFTDDLDADSLDQVELIMALEEEFSDGDQTLQISDEDAEKIRTVQETIDFIRGRGIQDS